MWYFLASFETDLVMHSIDFNLNQICDDIFIKMLNAKGIFKSFFGYCSLVNATGIKKWLLWNLDMPMISYTETNLKKWNFSWKTCEMLDNSIKLNSYHFVW